MLGLPDNVIIALATGLAMMGAQFLKGLFSIGKDTSSDGAAIRKEQAERIKYLEKWIEDHDRECEADKEKLKEQVDSWRERYFNLVAKRAKDGNIPGG